MPRPMKSGRKDLKRVQMDMPPKSVDRLKRLQELTEAASYAEVVRNALRLYEAMVLEAENGHSVYLERDGQYTQFPIFSA